MASDTMAVRMDTTDLAQYCAENTQLFFARKEHDDGFCFELFRRAMVKKAEDAWNHLYGIFASLTAGWVQAHTLFAACDEDVDFFVNEAFFRMARACTPEKFPRFSRLAQLLSYLKACVHGAITDHYERRIAPFPEGVFIDEIAGEPVERSVDAAVTAREERRELWEALRERLNGEKELVVVESFYLLDLKPRQIFAAHSDLFTDQQEVYQIKGNLLRRLRRDTELQKLLHQRD